MSQQQIDIDKKADVDSAIKEIYGHIKNQVISGDDKHRNMETAFRLLDRLENRSDRLKIEAGNKKRPVEGNKR